MSNFIDLDSALTILGEGWTIENVMQKIQTGELPAFVRIDCGPCDDNCDEYEIASITSISMKENAQSSVLTQAFNVDYRPIGLTYDSKQVDETRNHEIRFATEEWYHGHRVHGRLPLKSVSTIITVLQLCLLHSDVLTLAGGAGTNKNAAQTLAEIRHKTADQLHYIDKIMKHINSEIQTQPPMNLVINHLRFIKEAKVPEALVKSVTKKVRERIKKDYNASHQPLSRAPKKSVTEPYFFPLETPPA